MSVTGIASSILLILSASQHQRSPIQQIPSEFRQLGQDLQSGNLTQAQSDFTTLSQNLSGVIQNIGVATAATTTAAAKPQPSGTGVRAVRTGPPIRKPSAGSAGLRDYPAGCAAAEGNSRTSPSPPPSPRGTLGEFVALLIAASESDPSGLNQLAQSLQSGNLQSD
jgi:hypothetical protein